MDEGGDGPRRRYFRALVEHDFWADPRLDGVSTDDAAAFLALALHCVRHGTPGWMSKGSARGALSARWATHRGRLRGILGRLEGAGLVTSTDADVVILNWEAWGFVDRRAERDRERQRQLRAQGRTSRDRHATKPDVVARPAQEVVAPQGREGEVTSSPTPPDRIPPVERPRPPAVVSSGSTSVGPRRGTEDPDDAPVVMPAEAVENGLVAVDGVVAQVLARRRMAGTGEGEPGPAQEAGRLDQARRDLARELGSARELEGLGRSPDD